MRAVRIRLGKLPTDDFDAFCLDEYPEIYREFSSSASRQVRINLLLEREDPAEVDLRLTTWLGGKNPSRFTVPPKRRTLLFAALGAALFAALVLTVSTLVLMLQSRPVIVLVTPEQFEQQIVAHGLTMEHLDSPENFARKVQSAGPRGVRYEASTDQDRQTRELMRLVLALKIQNDQLVAATRYLAKEAGKWQHSVPPQLHLLTQLEQGIEVKVKENRSSDLAEPVALDLAAPLVGGSLQETPDEKVDAGQPSAPNSRGRGYLIVETPSGVYFRIDRGSYQTVTKAAIALPPGRHLVTAISGVQEVQITADATVTIHIEASPVEQLLRGGRDSFDRSDYTKAKKQLEKASALCARDRKQAQVCASLTIEISFLLGKIYEKQSDLSDAMAEFQRVAERAATVRSKNEQTLYAQAAIARLRPKLGQVIVIRKAKRGCEKDVNWLSPGMTYIRLNGSMQSVTVTAGSTIEVGSCQ